ncbi:MAG: type II toxin-antitoxin system VapB family antitoxin [Ignavibacteria bacterium]|jgi:hypothetical protein|nr:type II toxin-antitoxin system VapB family antitoxin [Ignavibacteria bacterium]
MQTTVDLDETLLQMALNNCNIANASELINIALKQYLLTMNNDSDDILYFTPEQKILLQKSDEDFANGRYISHEEVKANLWRRYHGS